MPIRRRRPKKTDIEKRIVKGIITSTEFLKSIRAQIKPKYFSNSHVAILVGWITEYFDRYKEAPGEEVQQIYADNEQDLPEGQSDLIEEILTNLSEEWVEEERSFNAKYLAKQAKEYFRERSLQSSLKEAEGSLKRGRLDEAEAAFRSYKAVAIEFSDWKSPFDDPEYIREVAAEKRLKSVVSLPPAVEDLFGTIQPGWCIGFLGPMKRGKSFHLMEFAMRCVYSRIKTVFFSLEMSHEEASLRFLSRLTGLVKDNPGERLIPIMDCKLNQSQECELPSCPQQQKVFATPKIAMGEIRLPNHRVCTHCRNSRANNFRFQPFPWYEKVNRGLLSHASPNELVDTFRTDFARDLLRIISYPRFSASLLDMEADLDALEHLEGFIPGAVVVDYAGIVKPTDKRLTGRDIHDDAWKHIARLAQERSMITASGAQGTRAALEKMSMKGTDTAEDIRALAHVDVMSSINQTDYEKKLKIQRLGLVGHRHKEFYQSQQVMLLQDLSTSQPMLDSQVFTFEPQGGKKKSNDSED